jgi:hypothetical protein
LSETLAGCNKPVERLSMGMVGDDAAGCIRSKTFEKEKKCAGHLYQILLFRDFGRVEFPPAANR